MGGTEPISVLVIEDDAGVRDTTVALLSESGYTVSAASDGDEGLDRLRTESCPGLRGPVLGIPICRRSRP